MSLISQDLLRLDVRQATLSPSALLQLRASGVEMTDYLQLVMQDLARGWDARQWGEYLEQRGALTVADMCWETAGLDPAARLERYRQAREPWERTIAERMEHVRQEMQRYRAGDPLATESKTQWNTRLREVERYTSQDWYDLAQEQLTLVEEQFEQALVAWKHEEEQLRAQQRQSRHDILLLHSQLQPFPSGTDGYQAVLRLLYAFEQMAHQPEWNIQQARRLLQMARRLCEGEVYQAQAVSLLLGEKVSVESPPEVSPAEVTLPAQVQVQDERVVGQVTPERQERSEQLLRDANYYRTTVKDFPQAEDCYREALRLWPGNESAAKNLANMLRQQKKTREAIAVLEEGVKHAQEPLRFYNLLTNYCTDESLFDDARDYAQRALRLVGDSRAEIGVLTSLVTLEMKASRIAKALDYTDAALRLNPDHEEMRLNKERLQTQLSGGGPTLETAGLESPGGALVDLAIEISPLLLEDLEACEFTKIKPDVLQHGNGGLLTEADRLFQETWQLNYKQYQARLDGFLQTAKLLGQIPRDSKVIEVASGHLIRAFSHYTGVMGDFLFNRGNRDAARDYYLEHIRFYRKSNSSDSPARAVNYMARVVNYFQTFLSTDSEHEQLAQFVLRTSPVLSQSQVQSIMRQLLEKMGQLAEGEGSPNQQLARGLRELACASDLLAEVISKIFDESEPTRRVFLPLVEALPGHSSISPTSEEPGDIFRQCVQDRHFSIKRQEGQLHQLVTRMGERLSLERASEEVERFTSYQQEWHGTDRRYFAKVRDLVRQSKIYFLHQGLVSEKEPLANSIIHDAETFVRDLKENPTFLGRAYFARIVYQLKRLVEKDLQEELQRSLPRLEPGVIDVSWAPVFGMAGKKGECLLEIANNGGSTAQGVRLHVLPSETGEYQSAIGGSDVGPIYPHQVASLVLLLSLDEKAVKRDAVDLLLSLDYVDRDNTRRETPPLRLRLPLQNPTPFTRINNPYNPGPPVVNSPLFMGRQELIKELVQEMTSENQTRAVLLYGQKRSGKTSILRNLEKELEKTRPAGDRRIVPVYFSMQSVLGSGETSTIVPEMFYIIATDIVRKYQEVGLGRIEDADVNRLINDTRETSLTNIQFRMFLDRIRSLPGVQRLVLLIDEFTELLNYIEQGRISGDIMKFLKSLIEQGFFSCLICGIDTIEIINTYSNQLAVAHSHMLGYLSKEAACQLIEEPIRLPDGRSRFASPLVLEEVLQLTAGSPYYIQVVCYYMVRYMNNKQRSQITRADLLEVLDDLISGSGAYDPYTRFDNLTRYVDDRKLDTYETLKEGLFLYLLAHETRNRPYAPFQDICQGASFLREVDVELLKVAEQLERRQVIERLVSQTETARQYRIVVGLFRHWVNTKRTMDEEMRNKFRKYIGEKAAF